jgi:hypothetical protein
MCRVAESRVAASRLENAASSRRTQRRSTDNQTVYVHVTYSEKRREACNSFG